ncbi:unnamed protein product [Amoebophrya sp. A120]|nr:unnamed protein product [Amoebophrya sp. A120]|eukprot:GSA120T00008824001.1
MPDPPRSTASVSPLHAHGGDTTPGGTKKMRLKDLPKIQSKKKPATNTIPPSDFYPWLIQKMRGHIFILFEIPEAGVPSRIVQIVILSCIACSVTTFIWESFPEAEDPIFGILEWVFTGIFTGEYVLRLWVCNVFNTQTRSEFLKDSLNIMDVCAILPAYLELAFSAIFDVSVLRVFRVVRLIRLFRIMRIGPFQVGVLLIYQTVKRAVRTLLVLFFILAIVVVFFGTLIYYTERWSCPQKLVENYDTEYSSYANECRTIGQGFTSRGSLTNADELCCDVFNEDAHENDEKTYAAKGFESIIHSLWWSLVTVSTVGYGDYVPQTEIGKYVGMGVMICGILILSLPVGIVGSKFHDAYNELDREPPMLKYYNRTFTWQARKMERAALLRKLRADRDNVLNEEVIGPVDRDDLASFPMLDDEEEGNSELVQATLRKCLTKMLESEHEEAVEEEKRRKGRRLPSDRRTSRSRQQKKIMQKVNKGAAITDMMLEDEKKEMNARVDNMVKVLRDQLKRGIVPKELLFPKVGCAQSDSRKMQEDVLGSLMKKAGMAKVASKMAASGSASKNIVVSDAKEYPLKDFEIITSNIVACLQYQTWLDERHRTMERVRKEMDTQLVAQLGNMLGEDWGS